MSKPSIEFIEASLIDALLLRSTSYNAFSVAKVTPISAVFDPLTNSYSRQYRTPHNYLKLPEISGSIFGFNSIREPNALAALDLKISLELSVNDFVKVLCS